MSDRSPITVTEVHHPVIFSVRGQKLAIEFDLATESYHITAPADIEVTEVPHAEGRLHRRLYLKVNP